MPKYTMGIDFGTLSGRAVIANVETSEELCSSVMEYPHGVMSDKFLNGEALPPFFALQHPGDYIEVLGTITKECIEKSGVNPADIIGVGVDFTASTVIPLDENGTPLCFHEKYKNRPHAYVKLWKHHGAQNEADKINELAKKENVPWLERYGGTISSEWLLPKVWEILNSDEEIYNETARFCEAGDYIVWQLTGKENHSLCMAGFKGNYSEEEGYPSKEFLKKLDLRLENIIGDKISEDICPMSSVAGYITAEAAKLTGLCEGTAVAPAIIDAHAALPAAGVDREGKLLIIIGTSSCHLLLGKSEKFVPGISGSVKNGIVDGYYAYEAGQVCVGDSFDWFLKNCVPESYTEEAREKGESIHKILREKAKLLPVGSGGVIALDWFNGNRTPYVDGALKGMLLGVDLGTKPEQIYRALIESTAYGTKRIIEIYEENDIPIESIYACGGIAEKDELLMQIYADVTGREIFLSASPQSCALGSAVLGAVAGGAFSTLSEASDKMKKIKDFSYKPCAENTEKYEKIYKEYKKLSEYFGKENPVMKTLAGID